ncbi:uncharacterized protein BDR25DRAFT_320459 [Lindgomyces ingoldianus]|uniref:Uncharacterized protein n=1 Tax=Lindgomyces ingoldianus TaxID=673940 RepID=A0ACB6Q8I7_9PLEO|nr:uncharacterized protein BDR25DRAFT_320459 [Lindgomyces ingoldianus]KAF2462850.1 hypothetical protein BDR25DRAFT_320459 [Lindgomyces ingoldianus]
MRCSESNLSLNLIARDNKLLGNEGKVVCMTQLSSDSWVLLRYRYEDVSGSCDREGLTLVNADRTSSPLSDTANDGTNHSDDVDEEDEDGSGEYRPHGASSDQRLGRDDMRFRKRTHVPWSKSNELRLFAYKIDMDMVFAVVTR